MLIPEDQFGIEIIIIKVTETKYRMISVLIQNLIVAVIRLSMSSFFIMLEKERASVYDQVIGGNGSLSLFKILIKKLY